MWHFLEKLTKLILWQNHSDTSKRNRKHHDGYASYALLVFMKIHLLCQMDSKSSLKSKVL